MSAAQRRKGAALDLVDGQANIPWELNDDPTASFFDFPEVPPLIAAVDAHGRAWNLFHHWQTPQGEAELRALKEDERRALVEAGLRPMTDFPATANAAAFILHRAARAPEEGLPLDVTLTALLADPKLLEVPASLSPWLVWAGELTALIGREKGGKSSLAASDATRAARAGRKVLWLTSEEGLNRVVKRFADLGSTAGLVGDRLLLLRRWPRSWEEIEEVIVRSRPDAVYVDSLSSFLMAVDGEVPATSEGEEWQGRMLKFKRWTTLCAGGVCVLAHATKLDGQYRGSTGIGAGPDTLITMGRVQNAPTARRLEFVGRWGFPSRTVQFMGDAKGYEEAQDLMGHRRSLTPARQRTLKALKPGMTFTGWHKVSGAPERTFADAVQFFIDNRYVTKHANGTYVPASDRPKVRPEDVRLDDA